MINWLRKGKKKTKRSASPIMNRLWCMVLDWRRRNPGKQFRIILPPDVFHGLRDEMAQWLGADLYVWARAQFCDFSGPQPALYFMGEAVYLDVGIIDVWIKEKDHE